MDKESTESNKPDRELLLLKELAQTEKFQLWAELVCKPVIQQLESDLSDPCKYSEADLKAKVLHLNSMKYLFEGIFEQIKAIKE